MENRVAAISVFGILVLGILLVHGEAAPPGPVAAKAIATRLSNPTHVTNARDNLPGENRLFITLQDGRILV